MANLANALKEEITQIAAREIRKQMVDLTRALKQSQRDIDALRRQLQKQAGGKRETRKPEEGRQATQKRGSKQTDASSADSSREPSSRSRFSPSALKAHRQRLGLSADNYGKLVGASGLSIYNWEQGKARPRKSNVEALMRVRGLGKRAARKLLDEPEETETSTAAAETSEAPGNGG